ncbi:MAG: hypothetical protein ACYTG5_10850 [Planctomycetota bacterium]|jgi:hypothetical protein
MNALIFGFGLLVTMLVGGGLATVIVAKNKSLDRASEDNTDVAPGPRVTPLAVRQEDW